MEKKKFNWNKFGNRRTTVHCKTEKEAKQFSDILRQRGYYWQISGRIDNVNYPYCNAYPGRLCFYADGKCLLYGNLDYANRKGHEIYRFSSYDFDDDTERT